MEIAEDFPDQVVWKCPTCEFLASPKMYREEWDKIGNHKGRKSVKIRILILALVLAMLAFWILT